MGVAGSALAAVLIKLAVAVLSYYQGRADFKDKVLLEIENAGLKRLAEGARLVAGDPASGTLGVRDPTQHTLP